jgi:hypothetical protein
VDAKKGGVLTGRVFHVGVQGAPWLLWRQIRVPGQTSIKELGKIVKVAFGWPAKSRGIFSFPYADGIQQLFTEEVERSVTTVFPRINDVLLFSLYTHGNNPWDHVVRCIEFQEKTELAFVEKGEGEPPRSGPPMGSNLGVLKVFLGGEIEAPEIETPVRTFDLVAANERLLNRKGVKNKMPYRGNPCRAIIWVESAPIRIKSESELKKLRTEIDQLESLIRQFEDLHKPAFQVWLRKRFGQVLSKLQQTGEKIRALRQRLNLISILSQKYRGRKSKAELLKLALAIEAGDAPWPEEPPEKRGGIAAEYHDFERMAQGLSEEERAYLEAEMAGIEAEYGELPPEILEIRDVLLSKGPATNDHRERCKSAYRKIVLLLHPDRGGEMDQQRLQLWYRAQTAYQTSDLVTLESILDGCAKQMVEKSISELLEAILESKRQIERLAHRIGVLKEDPAWNFASRKGKKLASRERRVERELAEQSEALDAELSFLEREIGEFERATKRARRKKPINQMEMF